MHKALQYPFDPQLILKKRRSIKKELLSGANSFIDKKIAVLGGSTTHDIISITELFHLNFGIRPIFYESEFGQWWQDAMFCPQELFEFSPDVVFIHTSSRNITSFPAVSDSDEQTDKLLDAEFARFESAWQALKDKFGSVIIIQNNFELPYFRLLGNSDTSNKRGHTNFINRLNMKFADYAAANSGFYINDINYLSADYGLSRWSAPFYWHMYKYCLALDAIPEFAFNLASIIKSIYGKNKKALALDLDNTLWGGVVGDDGVEGIEIGHETSMGQVYSEFQKYLKDVSSIGITLNVNSKNEYENAMAGLNHPESTLKPKDFIVIKANWETKDRNLFAIAKELNIGTDSIVFIDDNPAERAMVTASLPETEAPDIGTPENYIGILDRSRFFEVTELSSDDVKRNEMYRQNAARAAEQTQFADYGDYLRSLNMKAVIRDFEPIYIPRIAQLTNKSNQFNLTTLRISESEMENISKDDRYIRLYGKLSDKYGDNGVITVVIGQKENDKLHIKLWLMSCRVLKRDMELAMLDSLVDTAKAQGIKKLYGYYYKTAKNAMVKEFYGTLGFKKLSETEDSSEWELDISDYKNKNKVIEVES